MEVYRLVIRMCWLVKKCVVKVWVVLLACLPALMYSVMFISIGLRIPFRFFNCISYNRYGSETGIQVICYILVIIDIPVLQFFMTQRIFHVLEPPSLCTNELVVLSLQFLSYY